jgi:hypothetical protein
VPVAIVAGEPRSVEADHETGIAEADSTINFWKPWRSTLPAPDLPRSSSITCTRPWGHPPSDGAINQSVLQFRALVVLFDLV